LKRQIFNDPVLLGGSPPESTKAQFFPIAGLDLLVLRLVLLKKLLNWDEPPSGQILGQIIDDGEVGE
jgi:hypothetical protein